MSTKQSKQSKQLEFGRWLNEELRKRKLSREEFANLSGLAKGTINNLVHSNTGTIRAETIQKVAKALRVPEQQLLEMAGLAPALSRDDVDIRLLEFVYKSIDADNQRTLIRFANFLLDEHRKSNPDTPEAETWHYTQS